MKLLLQLAAAVAMQDFAHAQRNRANNALVSLMRPKPEAAQ